jgi:hypothetical protein
MKKFILSFILFFIFFLILIIVLGRNYHLSAEKSDYMAAIIDKHALLERTSPPRLILAGGSNLAFGIDSKRIEDSIGLPVINLGLHGGLGLDFIINEIKLSAKSKDIVIISIEYYLPIDGVYTLKKNAASFLFFANRFYKHNYCIDLKSFFFEEMQINIHNNITYLFKKDIKVKTNFDTSSIYARSSFNLHGDVVRHLNKPLPGKLTDKRNFTYTKWDGVKSLNEFSEYAKSNNIKVYFVFPNYPESEYILNKEVFIKYASDLKQELEIPILNNPDDFVFADSLFFDTVYHLNKKGREKRTNLLIKVLLANNIGKPFN